MQLEPRQSLLDRVMQKSATAPLVAKMIVCAIAFGALIYVVFVQGAQNVDADRGERAAEGIELTSEQAEAMTETASLVSDLIEEASIDESDSQPVGTAPSAQGSNVTTTIDAWYVRRIDNLMSRWGPRYSAAVDDIAKFEHRFYTTQDRLEEYFRQQADLTQSINDLSLRAELQNRDYEERQAYSRWMNQAHSILAQALRMRKDLDDMDAVIRKQQLTVSMLTEFHELGVIPNSVRSLHESLSVFRQQSDELARDLSSQIFSGDLVGN